MADKSSEKKSKKKKKKTVKKTSMPTTAIGQSTMLRTLNKVRWDAERDIRSSDDNTLSFTMMIGALVVLLAIIFNPDFVRFIEEDPEYALPFIGFYLFFIKRLTVLIRDYINPEMEQRLHSLSMIKAKKMDDYYDNLPESDLIKAFAKIGMGTNNWWELEEAEQQEIGIEEDED